MRRGDVLPTLPCRYTVPSMVRHYMRITQDGIAWLYCNVFLQTHERPAPFLTGEFSQMNPRLKTIIQAAIIGFALMGAGIISENPDKIPILLRSMIYFLIGLSIVSWSFFAIFSEPKRKTMVRIIDISWSAFSSLAALFALVAVFESYSENLIKGFWASSEQNLRFNREILTEELFSVCPNRDPVFHPCNEAWFALNDHIENKEMRIASARIALTSDIKINFPEELRKHLHSMASIGDSKEFVTVQTFARTNPNGFMFRYLVMIFAALRLSKSLIELWVPKDSEDGSGGKIST